MEKPRRKAHQDNYSYYTMNMNTRYTRSFLGLFSLRKIVAVTAVTAVTIGYAQDDLDDDEVFEFSPFLVDNEQNIGYRATSTLAGTRIKTNLSDIGSAISVITEEVFEDTGATDAETILPYSLNVEVSGVQGNFADVSSAGDNRVRNTGSISNSQGSTRVRGLSNALLARGLFQTDIPFDSYNTSVITINRGPNSLLFGASTPGGVIDQTLKQASFGEDFGEFKIRIGERGSTRAIVDLNQELLEDRLAIRLSLLNDENNYQQRPTTKNDSRAYFAVRAKLFEGFENGIIGRTTLRGNTEFGTVESTPPKVLPVGDGLTDWFQVPGRELEQFTGTVFPDYVDNFVPKQVVDERLGDQFFNTIDFPVNQPYFINMALIYAEPDQATPNPNIPNLSEVNGFPGRTLWRGVGGRNRYDTWGTAPFLAGTQFFSVPGFTVPVVMDRSILDNQNLSITGTLPYRDYEFDVQNIALEQELFGGNGGVELVYDTQTYTNEFYDPFNSGRNYELKIDVQEFLPNLQPNPNLGRVYLADQSNINWNETERESERATAFYQLDFSDREGAARWFGKHVFTGFYNKTTTDRSSRSTRNKWIDVPGEGTDVRTIVNDRLNGARRSQPMHIYLSGSLLGPEVQDVSDIRLNQYIDVSYPEAGERYNIIYHGFDRGPENTTGPAAPLDINQFEIVRNLEGASVRQEISEGSSFSWQSYLFNGNLVGLAGWRSDKFTTVENRSLENFLAAFPDANSDGLLDDGRFDTRRIQLADASDPAQADQVSIAEEDTFTWSVVGHLPRDLVTLPFNTRVSAHYSESESFVPTRARRDFNGDRISPETGTTREYGVSFDLLDSALSVRLNWFELNQQNATADSGINLPGVIGGGALRFWRDAEVEGISFEDALTAGLAERPALSPDITSYEDMYAAIINLLPQAQQDLYNIRFGPDGRTVLRDENPGQSVTTNATAEGFEVDIVGNITKNWSVIFNWGQQETITNDTAPIAGDIVLAVAENIAARGFTNVTTQPSLGGGQAFGTNWNGNVNRLVAARAKDGTASLEQREHRVNLVSTYSFSESRLKGFTVGGALRWQSEIATGYETQVSDAGIVTPIISKPFLGPTELNGDAWVSYQRELGMFNRTVDWKIQLNVRNLIGGDDYIPVVTNPNGAVAVVRNPPTKEFFLTNTFKF